MIGQNPGAALPDPLPIDRLVSALELTLTSIRVAAAADTALLALAPSRGGCTLLSSGPSWPIHSPARSSVAEKLLGMAKAHTGVTRYAAEAIAANDIAAFMPVQEEGVSSIALAPLRSQGALVGAVLLTRTAEPPFSSSDQTMLQGVALGLSASVQNASLLEEANRSLHDIGAEIVSLSTLDTILELIVDRAKTLLRSEIAYLGLVDESIGKLYLRCTSGIVTAEFKSINLRYGEGVGGTVIASGQPILINDFDSDQSLLSFPGLRRAVMNEGMKSCLCVPMRIGSKDIGVLYAAARRPNAFGSGDVTLLASLANQAAIAIDRARLYEIMEMRIAELEGLNRELEAKHELLRRSTGIHDALTRLVLDGRGIGAITNTLAELIGNPVIVQDQFWRLISTSIPRAQIPDGGEEQNRNAAQAAVLSAAATNPAVWEQFKSLRTDGRPIRTPATLESGAGASRAVAPILVGREILGYVSILDGNRTLEELDMMALERGATVLALEILKERTATEVEARLHSDFLNDLLLGKSDDEDEAIRRGSFLGYDLSSTYHLLVIDIDDFRQLITGRSWPEDDAIRVKRTLSDIVKDCVKQVTSDGSRARRSFIISKDDAVVVLSPLSPSPARIGGVAGTRGLAELIVSQVGKYLPEITVSVGIGPDPNGLKDFRVSYNQAARAVALTQSLGLTSHVVHADELGIYGLLLQADNQAGLMDFVASRLGKLMMYDRERRSTLVKTLEAFFGSGCSLEQAARACSVHVGTLKYRLGRIEEIATVDLADMEKRFELQFALKALKVLTVLGCDLEPMVEVPGCLVTKEPFQSLHRRLAAPQKKVATDIAVAGPAGKESKYVYRGHPLKERKWDADAGAVQ